MKKFLTTLTLILISSSAHADASLQEAKNLHMKNCFKKGQLASVCECSFDLAVQAASVQQVLEAEQMIAQGYRDKSGYTSKMRAYNNQCLRQARAGQLSTTDKPSGLALPPAPPPLPNIQDKIEPLPKIEDITTKTEPQNYIQQLNTPPKTPENSMQAIDEPESNPVVKPQVRRPRVVKPAPKPIHYFGQYDQLMFDSAARGDLDALRAVTPRIPDFDIINSAGDTVLIHSIRYGQTVSARYVIAQGANVNAKNTKGQTALHVASYMNRPDIVELLLNAKANPNEVYGSGYTPLILAIMKQDASTVNLLLSAKAVATTIDKDGNSLLHVAASGSDAQIIAMLSRSGININAPNNSGNTPLMVAAYSGTATVVKALVESGANIYQADSYGRTALNLAQSAGKADIVNLLLSYQSNR